MRELDPHFGAYEHLPNLKNPDNALQVLRKVASIVKPIMRKRLWRVGILCEFLPQDPSLQGLNVNKTERICLRLRYPGDPTQFKPLESVVDTLLHELCHIVIGPHNAQFQVLWDELRAEHRDLLFKGYTGEGFLSEGHRLGGRLSKRLPVHEMRRQARAAAEKRAVHNRGSGQKLGGAPVLRGADMRAVIAEAVARRNGIESSPSGKYKGGCASGTKEAARLAEQAKRNGFRTKAEEDDANDAAIAQALIELMEEDETRKIEEREAERDGIEAKMAQPSSSRTMPPPVPLESKPTQPSRAPNPPPTRDTQRQPQSTRPIMAPAAAAPTIWTCMICTLENPQDALECDACGTDRATSVPSEVLDTWSKADSTSRRPEKPKQTEKIGWNCRKCGAFMENQWWTCSACGMMKSSS
ncbi:WLM domain-containing protein [Lineolata rhizophorae]|uniref:WLM domain-containing protein n=1 Tax=Lineolata rhizophorae TaxID=578093 RepID=A0A6A6P6T5_9PEZI|nr:WLM domain-containing protein [Lineolata rhizophorae]